MVVPFRAQKRVPVENAAPLPDDVGDNVDIAADMASTLDRAYHDWQRGSGPSCISRKLTAVVNGHQSRIWLPTELVAHLQLQLEGHGHILLASTDEQTQKPLQLLLLPFEKKSLGISISSCSVLKRAVRNRAARHWLLLNEGELRLDIQDPCPVPDSLAVSGAAAGQLLPTLLLSIAVPTLQLPTYQQVTLQ